MSAVAHTPGPWKLGKAWGGGICTVDAIDPKDGRLFTVCQVLGIDDALTASPESKANAALIMAAPALLESLKEAVDALAGGLWDFGPGQDEHAKCDEILGRCQATLAAVGAV